MSMIEATMDEMRLKASVKRVVVNPADPTSSTVVHITVVRGAIGDTVVRASEFFGEWRGSIKTGEGRSHRFHICELGRDDRYLEGEEPNEEADEEIAAFNAAGTLIRIIMDLESMMTEIEHRFTEPDPMGGPERYV